jgi:hypothetical protein
MPRDRMRRRRRVAPKWTTAPVRSRSLVSVRVTAKDGMRRACAPRGGIAPVHALV